MVVSEQDRVLSVKSTKSNVTTSYAICEAGKYRLTVVMSLTNKRNTAALARFIGQVILSYRCCKSEALAPWGAVALGACTATALPQSLIPSTAADKMPLAYSPRLARRVQVRAGWGFGNRRRAPFARGWRCGSHASQHRVGHVVAPDLATRRGQRCARLRWRRQAGRCPGRTGVRRACREASLRPGRWRGVRPKSTRWPGAS